MSPVKVSVSRSKRTGRIHPGRLVSAQGKAAVAHLSRSLILGVSPVDGSQRPRKGSGKPQGFETGRLALGLHLGKFSIGSRSASVAIELPRGGANDEHRRAWVAKHPDVLSLEGNTARVIERALLSLLETDNDGRASTS